MSWIGPKFEVGKTYVNTSGLKVRCLYPYETNNYNCMFGEVLETRPISGWNVGDKDKFSGASWFEYHEPVVLKGKRKIFLTSRGDIFTGGLSVQFRDELVGVVEFTVTDGKLTDVKIL